MLSSARFFISSLWLHFLRRTHFRRMASADQNPEADIFRYCFPSGAPQTSQSSAPVRPLPTPQRTKRQRQEQQRQQHWQAQSYQAYPPMYPPPHQGAPDQLRLVSKILLQHEDSIQQIMQDRGFMLFFREDQRSLLPSMMAMSKEWHLKKDKGEQLLTSPLRTVLFANVIKEMLQRMQTIAATEEGRRALVQAQWMTETGAWTYQRWCTKARKLVLDESKQALQHDHAVKQLNLIHTNMKGDIIQSFHSTQQLRKLEEQGANSAAFKLEISLHGQEAADTHEALTTFINCSVTGLIGMSMKRETPQRGHLSRQLAQMVYGR